MGPVNESRSTKMVCVFKRIFLTAIAIQKKINEKNCILFEVFILRIVGANRLFSYIFIVSFGLPQNVQFTYSDSGS